MKSARKYSRFKKSITFKRFAPQGFTLIELLIVMAIIGILATIGVGFFVSAQRKTRDAQRKSDLKQIANALEIFYADYGRYPSSNNSQGEIYGCTFNPSNPTTGSCTWGTGVFSDISLRIYFSPLPDDPGGGEYLYRADATGTKYQLYATLENDKDPDYINAFGLTYADNGCGDSCHFSVTSPNTNSTVPI